MAIAGDALIIGDVPAAMVREAREWVAPHRSELAKRWKEMHS